MKKFYNLSLFVAVILFATSCITSKPYAAKFNQEQKKGRDTSNEVFVVKKDGEKIAGKKIKFPGKIALVQSPEPSEQWVAVDGKKIEFGQYEAVQTSSVYKALYHPAKNDQFPNVVYMNRLRFGKISLYQYEYRGSTEFNYQTKPLYHAYVFQKENGKPEALDFARFADAISDNSVAFERFKQLFPSGSIPKSQVATTLQNLTEVAELYNQTSINTMQASR
jgi:hypothetical protein